MCREGIEICFDFLYIYLFRIDYLCYIYYNLSRRMFMNNGDNLFCWLVNVCYI